MVKYRVHDAAGVNAERAIGMKWSGMFEVDRISGLAFWVIDK
jgi:hypothetical protein